MPSSIQSGHLFGGLPGIEVEVRVAVECWSGGRGWLERREGALPRDWAVLRATIL